MSSIAPRRLVAFACAIILILNAPEATLGASVSAPLLAEARLKVSDEWREASAVRVLIRSGSDWGRILFDDLNGTNSNGLRIRSIVSSGWIEGRDADDQLYVGHKIAWPDTEYDRVVVRKGDMVAFFKGLGDFHSTEVYADLVLEVNTDLPRVYVWLMTGGNGTTTFEIMSRDTGGTIWRDIVIGTGETVQVKRVMSPQPFFQAGRTESTIVVVWWSIAIIVIIVLNFPILELLTQRVRRKTGTGIKRHAIRYGESGRTAEGAMEHK